MTCGGMCASACMAAMLPSLVITGCHSLPMDLTAFRTGFDEPSTGTVQRCRLSMSSWFELKTIRDRSGARLTYSTSKLPGVSSVALPPLAGTE